MARGSRVVIPSRVPRIWGPVERGAITRQRNANLGDAAVVKSGQQGQPFAWASFDNDEAIIVYAQAVITAAPAVAITDLQVLVDIEWGVGGGFVTGTFDASKRLRVPLVASFVKCIARLVNKFGGAIPPTAVATVRGFIARGNDGLAIIPSTFGTVLLAQANGSLGLGQQIAFGIFGDNEGAAAGWLYVFDSAGLPPNGTAPILAPANVPAGQTFAYDLPNGIAVVNGLYVAASSLGTTFTYNAAGTFTAQAELQR